MKAAVFPYILFSMSNGGNLNDSPHTVVDVEYLITAVDDTSPQAKVITDYIETALKDKTITYPSGWYSWARVRQTEFFSRMINIQNVQYWQTGSFYRFRATEARA